MSGPAGSRDHQPRGTSAQANDPTKRNARSPKRSQEARAFFFAGGVVQDYVQVVLALILKPMVIAAVDVQHHPWQWTPLTPLAMHPAPGLALHQTGCL
jgi:hypothetical protein